jgi:hypothetical protein
VIPAIVVVLAQLSGSPAANDWITTGGDCSLFAAGDLDLDGYADVVTLNGSNQLCVSYSVRGWKASPWTVAAEGVAPTPTFLEVEAIENGAVIAVGYTDRTRRFASTQGGPWTAIDDGPARAANAAPGALAITPPPFEPDAKLLLTFAGDFSKDGVVDTAGLFECGRPSEHRVVRVAIAPNAAHDDQDHDELSDAREQELGTDPFDRDSDDDGFLDGFEVNGLPRGVRVGDEVELSPRRQDVICIIAPYEGIDVALEKQELARAAALFAALPTKNPDGSSGIRVHFRMDPIVTKDRQHNGSWFDCGNAHMKPEERGLFHWMQITPYGGGQAQQTGDMGGCGAGFAVFTHEFGHQLSLPHTGDSMPAWCPLYPSLMSYAFSYSLGGDANAIRFSDGRFRSVALVESKLEERLPFPYEELKYLEAAPFRFTLQDDGTGGTRIDWNHNGRFDEQPVCADVNYGGSTHGGFRRNIGLSGSGTPLAVVAGKTYMIHSSVNHAELRVREYLGDEKWSDGRAAPSAATLSEPIVVGGESEGIIFTQSRIGWRTSRFDASVIDPPVAVPDFVAGDLSAARIGTRVLLIRRDDDGSLAAAWYDHNAGKPTRSTWQPLELKSDVPPGFAQEQKGGRIAVATSWTNSQNGRFNLRVTWFTLRNDALVQGETLWTHGEGATNHCTTRPIVSFKDGEQLCIFHTAWPNEDGTMTMWRTLRVGNLALNQGWLTSMLYDGWTLTRVPLGFADGPQGAIFAFRWDAGDVNGTRFNDILVGHDGYGIDDDPMRDFDDGAQIALWGIRHSILTMSRTP